MNNSDRSLEPRELFLAALYCISMLIAFGMEYSFVVTKVSVFLLLGSAFTFPAIIAMYCHNKHPFVFWAILHFILAAAVHPGFRMKEEYVDAKVCFGALKGIFSAKTSLMDQADLAYKLSCVVREKVLQSIELSNPVLYWLYPPTIVLCIWGIFFVYKHFNSNESDSDQPEY